MSCVAQSSSLSSARPLRLSPGAAFLLLASITVSFLAGSSAPTPLYAIYQSAWGFSPVVITIVFGIYALAVLAALLVVGRLSDHVGRRPVLLAATVAQALSMIVFATADSLSALLVARIVQGLATGAAVAAVGAGLLDLDKTRGAVANAIAPPSGTALGAIAAGLMVQYLPAPTQFIYWTFFAIFVLQGMAVLLMAEPSSPRDGAWASLKPQLAVPAAVREPLVLAIPVLVAGWALAGFYASLGPAVVRMLSGTHASLLGGVSLFVLAGSAALAILLSQRMAPRALMSLGASALLVGVGISLASLSLHGLIAFLVGTAVAGVGFGTGFQGAVRTVVPAALPHQRAGVLSVVFIVSYVAMGVPAVIAGAALSRLGELPIIARDFGGLVMFLAAVALGGIALAGRRARRRPDPNQTKAGLMSPDRCRTLVTPARPIQPRR